MQHHVTGSRMRRPGGVWVVAALLALFIQAVGLLAQVPTNPVPIELPLEASQVVVRNPASVTTTVEWLELTSTSLGTVATRRELSDSFQIAVADAPGRLVRFSRDGASPVSVNARLLLDAKDWSLPEAVPGGEVIWSAEPAPVTPIRYQFSGASSWTSEVFGGSVDSRWGLSPGSYLAVPEYHGGLKGEAVRFSIDNEKSTVLRLPAEQVGAVRVTAAADSCEDAPSLAITKITNPSPVSRIGEHLLSLSTTEACTWLVSGLPQGNYQVSLRTSLGSAGTRDVAVSPQVVTSVTMASPVVTVSGKVSLNGQPVTDVTIRWARQGTSDRHLARTDSNGDYSIKLDQPGAYTAVVETPTLGTSGRRISLNEGENTVDWSFSGGVLDITIRGWDESSDAVVELRSVGQSSSVVLKPGQEPRIRRAGLAFTDYSISVRQEQAGRVVGATRRVSLEAGRPELVVTLDLQVRSANLIVTDDTGQFVQGATIRIPRATVSEVEPGRYLLDGVQGGTPIRIIPPSGLVPVCRTMTDGETVAVSVRQGRRVVIELPAGMESLTLRDGALVGVADSDCPVPLVDFRSQKVPTANGQPIRLALDGFPPIEQVSLSLNGRVRTVSVPLSGSAVVRLFQ